jgi:hypothetical protein
MHLLKSKCIQAGKRIYLSSVELLYIGELFYYIE